MDINLTLFGEMITFAVLIFVTLKYIWPPLTKAMEERRQKIADGLAAAERGQHSLEVAQQNATEILRDARGKANNSIDQAQQEVVKIVEAGRNAAKSESSKLLAAARADVEKEKAMVQQELKKQVADLAIVAARKALQNQVDAETDRRLFDQVMREMES